MHLSKPVMTAACPRRIARFRLHITAYLLTTLLLLFNLGLAKTAFSAGPGDIITVAGGWIGDDNPATSAKLNGPMGSALDSDGNLYIADTGNHRIRKVATATGIITTVAGNGNPGYSGDSGAATLATLNGPQGVAIDSDGNLYIVDTGNHRIRKVAAATGIITTVAGNGTPGYSGDGDAATLASLYSPQGMAIDNAGNMYIADGDNSRIRKVEATSGIITTVAGNGNFDYSGDGGAATSAALNYPTGVAVDSDGNLYIADTYNARIRKVTAATGIITTVAGIGIHLFTGDDVDATSTALNYPAGVAVDSSGNLYIADTYNARIRKVTAATGIITTVAGNGTAIFAGDGGAATSASLSNPSGITLDSSGNLYIADTNNYRIRKVAFDTGIISTIAGIGGSSTAVFAGDDGAATSASLAIPSDVAVDSSGNLYIADRSNHRIRKVSAATGIITTVAGNGTATFAGDGGSAASASLKYPTAITLDSNDNLYIADAGNNRIRKVASDTGIITTIAGNGTTTFAGDGGPATSASLYSPSGIALDSNGNLYIADTSHYRIRRVAADTGIITTVAGNGTATFAGDGGPATLASISAAYGLSVDSMGNLLIADSGNNRIRMVVTSVGIIITVAGNGTYSSDGDGGVASSAGLIYPKAITLDPAGNLYISESSGSRIRKVTAATGIITTVAGNGDWAFYGDGGAATSAALYAPRGVVIDSASNLYIADSGNNRIRMVMQPLPAASAATGMVSSVASDRATLNGTINDNTTDTVVTFEYGLTTDYGNNVSGGTVVPHVGSTQVSALVSGLLPNTTYHFRIVGTSDHGTITGNDNTFITALDGVCSDINLCSAGTPSIVTGTGPFSWTCAGLNGGSTASCSSDTISMSLSITKTGTGTGTVTGDAGALTCGSTCTGNIPFNTVVTLTAVPDIGSSFTGWSGSCSGIGVCQVTMDAVKSVSASFQLISTISAAGNHSVMVKSDGTVWTWGSFKSTLYGYISLPSPLNETVSIPVQVGGLSDVKAVSAGEFYNLALKSDGTVWAWGYFPQGLYGNGSPSYNQVISSPIKVDGLTGITAIAAGMYHAVALRNDGTVWAWGENGNRLGDGTTLPRTTPVQVLGLSGVTAITAKGDHSSAIKNDGTVWSWGAGILGNGTTASSSTPVQAATLSNIIAISAGETHTIALKADGTVWGWGSNGYGELGDGSSEERTTPVQASGLTNITAISAGYQYSMALRGDGTVWGSGVNTFRQIGASRMDVYLLSPVQAAVPTGITEIAAGGEHTLALKSDGSLWGWGSKLYGQLGDGIVTVPTAGAPFSSVPLQVNGMSNAQAVAAGYLHTVMRAGDGTVWAWGYNGSGQLGNGTTATSTSPRQVSGLTNVSKVAAGYNHTVALKNDGTVWSWGSNSDGQLGDSTTTQRLTPVQVSTFVTSVVTGKYYTVALKGDGTVWAWGNNQYGQLGDGSITNRSTPVQVTGLSGVVAIAAGVSHTMALKSDGTVWAWGNGGYLSYGYTPVQVSGLNNVTSIVVSINSSLALKSDGTVWAWGDLYSGSTYSSSAPVQVEGLSAITAISAGNYYGIALRNDGMVWAWGYGIYGQLGNGTTSNRSNPVQVSNLSGVTAIAAGDSHGTAINGDRTVYTWGLNGHGQLGNGMPSQALINQNSGPLAITGNADGIGLTSATLHGTTNDNGADTSLTFEYGLTPAYGSSVSGGGTVTAGSGVTPVSANLTALACGTTYHFRFTGSNSTGTLSGADQAFTTLSCSATIDGSCGASNNSFFVSAPTSGLCSVGTASSVTGSGPWSWTCSGLNGGSTATCTAGIQSYSVTPSAGSNGSISPATPQSVVSGLTTSFTVTPDAGYTASVGGTCGGTLEGSTYTTNAITADCTVVASFSDTTAPVTSASPAGGIYGTAQTVTLSCSDTSGTACAAIYYTTDGSEPTTASAVYSGPLTIYPTTTLKFFAKDSAGNSEAVKSEVYTLDTARAAIPRFVYVANSGSNDISVYSVDHLSGALTAIGTPTATQVSPAAISVSPSGKFAYAVNMVTGSISTFVINQASGSLTAVGAPVTTGSFPDSISIDPTGRFAYVANIDSENISAYSIEQNSGALTEVTGSPFPMEGTSPYAVTIDPTGRFVYVANIYSDNVSVLSIDQTTGALTAGSPVSAGTGVRSVAVDPTGRFVYVANQSSNNVSVYTMNQTTGALTAGSPVSAGTGPVSVTVEPSGRFAYVANRTSNTISVFTIDHATGALTAGTPVSAGTAPRSISVDPSGQFVFAANQNSNNISVFLINQDDGSLTAVSGAPFAAGTSPSSVAVTTGVSVPLAPPSVTATASNASAILAWNYVSGATSYNVYYSTSPNVTTTTGTKVAGVSTGIKVAGLANDTTYYFVVTAVNTNGESAVSSEVSATPLNLPPPDVPANLKAASGNHEITISWEASAGATSYTIYYSTSSGVSTDNSTKMTNASPGAVISGLDNARTYYIVVTASNAFGESDTSGEVSATPQPAPGTPKFAYVTNLSTNNVSVYTVDQNTGVVSFVTTVAAGVWPVSVAVDPAGRFAYVANSDSNDISVYSIDQISGVLNAGASVNTENTPESVTVDPSGRFAYAVNRYSNTVSVYRIDQGTGALIAGATVQTGTEPRSITIDPSARFAYVANYGSNNVSVYAVDTITGSLTAVMVVPAGTNPRSVMVDPTARFAYVANYSDPGTVSMYRIDQSSGALVSLGSVATGLYPRSAAVDPSGRFVYVANEYNSNGNNISVYSINQSTGELVTGTSVAAGQNPWSITVDPSGKFVYVANFWSNTPSVFSINQDTGALSTVTASPYDSGSNPTSIVVTAGINAPVAPLNLSATPGIGSASLRWNYVSGATSYNVYYSTSPGVTTAGTKVTNATNGGVISNLTGGVPYYFVVTAVNEMGESVISSEVTTTPLVAYTVTFATDGNGSLVGSTSQTVVAGSSTSEVSAVPVADYQFVNWTGTGGFVTTTANPLTVSNVTATMAITANFVHIPVPGVCGSSSGASFTAIPTTNLCSVGSASAVTGTGSPWSWTCSGSHGGADANCSALQDITGPTLVVSALSDGSYTNNATLNISGTVSDATAVASLTVNGVAVTVNGDGSYSTALTLFVGANNFTLVATDSLGNTTTNSRTVTLDQTAPELTITSPADNSVTGQNSVSVTGTVSETAVVKWRIGTAEWQSATLDGTGFSFTATPLLPGLNTIEITATDQAGNTVVTTAKRSITYDNANPELAITSPSQDITTSNSSITLTGTVSDSQSSTTVSISINGQVLYSPNVTDGSFSQEITLTGSGSYAISVIATDGAGHTATATRNILYQPYHTVTPSAGLHGSITPNTPQTIDHNSTTQFTVTPEAGYTATVGGSCGGSLEGNTYTTNAITTDCTVTATFSDGTAPGISAFSATWNSGTLTAGITLTATDNTGVTGWCVSESSSYNGCSWSASAPASYTFSSAGTKTLYAYVVDASGNGTSSSTTVIIPTSTLTTSITGTGKGTVTSNPAGISCTNGSCSAGFVQGSSVTLLASPSATSTFDGWTGACSGSSCTLTMDAAKSATATFTQSPVVKNGSVYYSLATAYSAAGATATLYLLDAELPDSGLNMNANKAITLLGGYTTDFITRSSNLPTTLNGPLTISTGSVTVDRIVIK